MTENVIYFCSECSFLFKPSEENMAHFKFSKCKACGRNVFDNKQVCSDCGGEIQISCTLICPKCESRSVEITGQLS